MRHQIRGSLRKVVDGIHAAQVVDLSPVKANCVLLQGWNDDQFELLGVKDKVRWRKRSYVTRDGRAGMLVLVPFVREAE